MHTNHLYKKDNWNEKQVLKSCTSPVLRSADQSYVNFSHSKTFQSLMLVSRDFKHVIWQCYLCCFHFKPWRWFNFHLCLNCIGITAEVWNQPVSLDRSQSFTPHLSLHVYEWRERETSKIFISFSKRSELNMACFNCKHLLQFLMETTVSVIDGPAHGMTDAWRDSTGNKPHPCVIP